MASTSTFSMAGPIMLLLVLFSTVFIHGTTADSCVKTCTPVIPRWHIYHKLCKPIIIGHRGNPLHYQENTMEGFKSVHRFGANAFELDVYLTVDGELVVFHDRNTLRTTGENWKIQEIKSSQITTLRYLKKIKYGPNTIKYNRRRRITFLHQVLRWAKGKKILIMLEIKPTDVLLNVAKEQHTAKTSEAVAKMVRKFNMHDQIIVISFNYYAALYAKRANPKLTIGTMHVEQGWHFPSPFYHLIKKQLERLIPGLKDCLASLPSNNKLLDYLFTSGSLEKLMQASLTFISPGLFNNQRYGGSINKNTMGMVRRNYGEDFVVGTGGFYNIKLPKSKIQASLPTHRRVIKLGVKMIFTDDIIKTKRLVRKTLRNKRHRCHHGYHHRHKSYDKGGDQYDSEVITQEKAIKAAQNMSST